MDADSLQIVEAAEIGASSGSCSPRDIKDAGTVEFREAQETDRRFPPAAQNAVRCSREHPCLQQRQHRVELLGTEAGSLGQRAENADMPEVDAEAAATARQTAATSSRTDLDIGLVPGMP